ncbi:hypothetical protein OUZ56_013691 [Daphnia magna]|uniref:Secreted protein n=1 Tax=Daphnia magna TaxID=35525 RepID=A0ABQ9Z6N8_9CRUS|nr:hypothetical protein OUZ56_013691 [Daphnia magna]
MKAFHATERSASLLLCCVSPVTETPSLSWSAPAALPQSFSPANQTTCVSAYLVEMNGAMASAPMAAVFVPLPPLFMAMIISIMNATTLREPRPKSSHLPECEARSRGSTTKGRAVA